MPNDPARSWLRLSTDLSLICPFHRQATNMSLDSLPYVDRELEVEGARDYVQSLIAEEIKKSQSRPENPFPTYTNLFEDDPLLKQELARVRAGTPLNAIDISKFRLDAPAEDQADDPDAWLAAVENAHAQLEHQHNRLINLELMNKFGANAWKLYNFQLEHTVQAFERKIEEERQAIVEINKQRKLDQQAHGTSLYDYQQKYMETLNQVVQLDVALMALEAEVEMLREWKAKNVDATSA
ncbi:Pre-mRNA-splicing factor SPF27 [Polychytrium aggregatum]|uniref:Pre-mRNA-splicing factor SPF27 n=1 Tax=Polychytrium aggregatum TaxID=110093 RepID=UPI0022FDB482|nr:Pre-mRNA-splicing factor SPF27 [Polychytrium aggregatum]KAI9193695.1 Pre-mRNA-splicing factor SPF27 [Polychytrium aggregatum]